MKSKRLLLMLLMALLVPWAANAQTSQTLTVYENEASTTIREAPMYVYYFDDFTRAHTVFPKEDLSDMACGTITSITFYTTSENIPYTTVSSADIYLTEVSNASISAFIDKSSATVVASDYFDFVSDGNNGGMVTITFTTPYEYHGGNLLFGCDNTEDVNYKSIYFKGKSASGASFSGSNGSATPTSGTQRNFLPKTTFTFIPSPFLAPATIAYTNNEPGNTTVSWTAPNTTETVTGYAYHFKKKDVTEWPEYTPVDANVTSVELPNLAFFTEYEFEVKTLYGNNESCSAKKISFTTLDNCMTPENLTITNVTYNSAKFNWTEGFGNGEWKFGYKTGEEEFTYVDVVAADLPLTLNVFEEQRTYNVVVYPLCDPEKTITDQFTTPCAPTTIPSDGWSENFDSYTHTSNSTSTNNLPGCWNYINTTTYSYYKGYPYVYYSTSTSYSYSPNYHLRFYSSYSSSSWSNYDPQPQYAILPPMDNLKGKQVTLQARGANTSSTFKIGTMSDPTNANTFEMITEQTGLTTSYEEFMYVIPANCTNKYVVIMIDAASSSRTTNSVYIDDIVIGEAQTCFKPGKPVATLTPGNGSIATLTWTRNINGTEDAWVLQYGTDANFTDGTYTEVEVTGGVPTKDIDNLTSDETYYARVKPICDTEGNLWSDVSDAFTPTDQYVVTVNNGNTTNGYAPLVTNYKSSYDQMIYTAAQLQSVGINGPCEITKIGFNAAAANTIKRLPTLYIGITDKEKFENSTDFVSINDLTLVYSREYSDNTTDPDLWEIKAGWNEFVLDEPFEYDGTSNLVIAMHCGIASYYSSTSFYTNATTNNQVIYAYNDNINPDPLQYEGTWSTYSGTTGSQQQLPSMKMYYEPVTCPRPTGLAIAPNSLTANGVSFTWNYEDGEVFQFALTLESDPANVNFNTTWNAGDPFPEWNTLSADTDWYFYLRKVCSDTDFSREVHILAHTLELCPTPEITEVNNIGHYTATVSWTDAGNNDPYTVSYRVAGHHEFIDADFENGNLPTGWTSDGNPDWSVGIGDDDENTGAHNSNYNALNYESTGSGYESYLITPAMDLSDKSGLNISLWYINRKWVSDIDGFGIYYRINEGNWEEIFYTDENHETWTPLDQQLPDGAYAANCQIGFRFEGNYGHGVAIDDITLGEMVDAGTWQTVPANAIVDKTASLSGLSMDTKYEVKVATSCGSESESISFTTVSENQKYFLGTESDEWLEAGNWEPAGAPTYEQTAELRANVTITGEATAKTIDQSTYAITIEDGGKLKSNSSVYATVKKHINAWTVEGSETENPNGYYLITNPTTSNVTPSAENGFLVGNYDLYSFDYTKDMLEWRNYKDESHPFTQLNSGSYGYLYANKNGTELTYTDNINAYTGNKYRYCSIGTGSYHLPGWYLLGNPYMYDAYLANASNNGTGMAYYRMNDTHDGFEAATACTPIAPMEGFFYQGTTGATDAYVVTYEPAAPQQGQLEIVLSQGRGTKDNAIIVFGGEQQLSKMSFREGSSKIYMPVEGKDFAIVSAGNVGEMPVSFKAEKNGSYNLSFTCQEVSFSYLHLIDNMTGNDVDLLANPSYSFSAQTTDYASRFRLVFATGSSVDGDNFGFINGMGNLCIFGIDGTATVQVVDVTGRMLSSETFSGSYERKLNVAPGVYMIRLINGNDVKVQKMIVR